MNTIDMILVIFLSLSALNGAREGLVRSIGGLIALIAGIWAAILFRQPLVFYFENKFGWVSSLESWLIEKIPFFQLSTSTGELVVSGEPTQFDLWLTQMKAFLLPPMSHFNPAEQLAMVLITALAFIFIFLLVRCVIEVVIQAIDHLVRSTPLNPLNRLLGLAAGILKGMLYLMVIFLVLLPVLKTSAFIGSEWANNLVHMIDQSFIFGVTEGLKQLIVGLL